MKTKTYWTIVFEEEYEMELNFAIYDTKSEANKARAAFTCCSVPKRHTLSNPNEIIKWEALYLWLRSDNSSRLPGTLMNLAQKILMEG